MTNIYGPLGLLVCILTHTGTPGEDSSGHLHSLD